MATNAKETERKKKLAIVMPGGAMRCVYGMGALTALVEEYGITEPDIIIASSAGAANAAYYLSGQYREIIGAWLSLLPEKHLVSFRKRQMLDVDRLIDEVFKKEHPLDLGRLASAKTLLYFAATRVRDGKTVYLAVPRDERVYEYLRATAAVPIAYGKSVMIGKDEYVDGDFGSDAEDLVHKALSLGATDIIIIDSSPREFSTRENRALMEALRTIERIRKDKGMTRAISRELARRAPIIVPKGRRIVRIKPSKNLHTSRLQNTKLKLRTAFNLGYADTRGDKELEGLLS